MDKVAYLLTICMSLLALSCGDGHKVNSRIKQVTEEKNVLLMPIRLILSLVLQKHNFLSKNCKEFILSWSCQIILSSCLRSITTHLVTDIVEEACSKTSVNTNVERSFWG